MAMENVVVGGETIAPPSPAADNELIMPSSSSEEEKMKTTSKRRRRSPPPTSPEESSSGHRFSSDEGDAKRRHLSRAEMERAALTIVMISRGAFGGVGGPRRDRDLPPPPPPPPPPAETKARSYECSTCGKAFPTPQALGGHSTSHGRKPAAAADVTAVSTSIGSCAPAAAGGKAHECPRCHKSFSTGQALGGHMRRHFAGAIGGAAAAAERSASKERGAPASLLTEKPKKDLGFDLNEPATPMAPGWI